MRRTSETRRCDANLVTDYRPHTLLRYRLKAGISPGRLAEGIGVKEADVRKWEEGRDKSGIPYATLMAMARMLKCTVGELLS